MTVGETSLDRLGGLGEFRDCPYFGLDYFRERDGGWFFGRDADSERVIINLQAARLTLLHGESGVGKSSLLRAGVVWKLREALGKGTSADIPVVFASWQDDPVDKLIGTIGKAIKPYVQRTTGRDLSRPNLDAAIAEAAAYTQASLVVLLDQFEEYFLYSSTEQPKPENFADQLARCLNRPDLPANFLVAIREEAYARFGELLKGRISNVYSNYLPVAYLDRGSAEDAIRKPLLDVYNRQPGVEPVGIEDGLVEAVLRDVRVAENTVAEKGDGAALTDAEPPGAAAAAGSDDRVATPLLQLVMQTIWDKEKGNGSRTLRLATFQELKGVENIVDSHLSRGLSHMGRSSRETAIDLLDHLVDASGGKIAATVADLALRTGHSEAQTAKVLQKLDEDRVVTSVQGPPGQDAARFRRYEIFHDVLGAAIARAVAVRAEARRTERARLLAGLAIAVSVIALAIAGGAIYLWRTEAGKSVHV